MAHMVHIPPSEVYRAPHTEHTLKAPSALDKKWVRVAYNIISVVIPIIGLIRLLHYGIQKLVVRIILLGAFSKPAERRAMREAFQARWFSSLSDNPYLKTFRPQPVDLHTADNVKLSACYFRHHRSNQNTPVIIVCQPNLGTYYSQGWEWMFQEIQRREEPCNFLFFDYRGYGDSEGHPKSVSELVKDVSAAREYVRNKGHKNVKIYGHSLGGMGGLIPDVEAHALDRTFAVISHIGGRFYPPAEGFITWILEKVGCEVNVREGLGRSKSRKLVLFRPDDEIMSGRSSLHNNLPNTPVQTEELFLDSRPRELVHGAPIYSFRTYDGTRADRKIMDFLLSQQAQARSVM